MPVSGDKIRVGFLGAGRMAAALAKGLVSADFAAADSLIASDPLPAARDAFTAQCGGRTTASNVDVLKSADVVVLAVKPQHVSEVLMDVRSGSPVAAPSDLDCRRRPSQNRSSFFWVRAHGSSA